MINCLKQLKDKKLVTAVSKLFVFANSMPFSPFAPVVEKTGLNPFLTENPYKLLNEGKLVNDVPWATSNTADEGLFAVGGKLERKKSFTYCYVTNTYILVLAVFRKLEELGIRWNEVLPYVLDYFNTVDDQKKIEVSQKIRDFYGIGPDINVKNVSGLIKVLIVYEITFLLEFYIFSYFRTDSFM